jgi:hypothetical protein
MEKKVKAEKVERNKIDKLTINGSLLEAAFFLLPFPFYLTSALFVRGKVLKFLIEKINFVV